MADAILTPPPAQIAAAKAAPAKVGSEVPSQTGEIKAAELGIPHPVEGLSDPKPGSARERLRQDLVKASKPAFGNEPTPRTETPPSQKPADAKPAATEKGQKPPTEPTPGDKTPPTEKQEGKVGDDSAPPKAEPKVTEPTDDEISAEAKKGGKVNPWKLVETYKKKAATLEKDLSEKAKLIVNEDSRKQEVERLTKAEARAKELEDHIKYVDYSKSTEFNEKYETPYTKAWEKAVGELKELTVTDPESGDVRAFDPKDMLELVNLPLPEARKLAIEAFGDFADDVMAQRKEIRQLFDKRADALTQAKTEGVKREELARTQAAEMQKQISSEVTEHWAKLNEEVMLDPKHGKYFQPVEGDDEANQRLEKGYQLVDDAFTTNPMDPRLKPEERKAIIQKHVAVRNRAAAFGRLVHLNSKMEARVAELEQQLSDYKDSTPKTEGQLVPGVPPSAGTAKDRMRQALMKYAK